MTGPMWRIEPLATWPHPPTVQRSSAGRFRSSWSDTLDLLRAEAEHLRARPPLVVSLVCDPSQVRADGMLRAHAQVGHAGAVLTLAVPDGPPLVLASDAYESHYTRDLASWQANLRAIGLGLAALRDLDRWGITRTGQQYAGFRQLPTGTSGETGWASPAAAARWVQTTAADLLPQGEGFNLGRSLRLLRARAHPDSATADPALWSRVEAAERMLRDGGLL